MENARKSVPKPARHTDRQADSQKRESNRQDKLGFLCLFSLPSLLRPLIRLLIPAVHVGNSRSGSTKARPGQIESFPRHVLVIELCTAHASQGNQGSVREPDDDWKIALPRHGKSRRRLTAVHVEVEDTESLL